MFRRKFLQGRWAVLATRAARTGALDYEKVTRGDADSMSKEYFIMLDMERELLADTFATFDMVYAKPVPLFTKQYVDTKLPWLFGENAQEAADKKKGSMVSQLVGLYGKLKNRKKE